MEKYLVRRELTREKPRARARRHPWKRSMVELNGRIEPTYRHDLSALLMHSYSEIGAFRHLYQAHGGPCPTHMLQLADGVNSGLPFRKQGVSSVEFDNKGIYLVSATRSGCITVHDFEALYCQSKNNSSLLKEDESKQVLHLSLPQQLDTVRWNPANQDEVVCSSRKSSKVLIFDISYISCKPVEVLQTSQKLSVLGSDIHRGLCDLAFTTDDDSRIVASDTHGLLNVWDRRTGVLPCMELATGARTIINSIKISAENHTLFGAGQRGVICVWDLRGRTTTAAFRSHKEISNLPLTLFNLAPMMRKIRILKEQSEIIPKEIHSININPSCSYQLAFHLDDGWSGVLDTCSFEVTHVHCPPPPWLDGSNSLAHRLHLRKPSWLATSCIYAVPSLSENGIHLLDFYPSRSSPCHVDYIDDVEIKAEQKHQIKRNRFIPLSKGITACVVHPLNNTIVAGTENSSLLLVSQRHQSPKQESVQDDPSQPTDQVRT